MFKNHKQTRHPYLLLVGLPLLILGGCASQETIPPAEDSVTPATEINQPVKEVQDPIAMQESHATEFDTEDSESVIETGNEVQPAVVPASMPQQQLIGFAFDQAEVDEQYHELLKQHARYLAENKELKLRINGHTDSFGPKEYNQYLSKQRAESVAKLLVNYGAPEDRLIIEASADNQPLFSATTQSEHRRVELDYQDQRLVSYE